MTQFYGNNERVMRGTQDDLMNYVGNHVFEIDTARANLKCLTDTRDSLKMGS